MEFHIAGDAADTHRGVHVLMFSLHPYRAHPETSRAASEMCVSNLLDLSSNIAAVFWLAWMFNLERTDEFFILI